MRLTNMSHRKALPISSVYEYLAAVHTPFTRLLQARAHGTHAAASRERARKKGVLRRSWAGTYTVLRTKDRFYTPLTAFTFIRGRGRTAQLACLLYS